MKEALWQNIVYFKVGEFKCNCGTCGSTGNEMDYFFMRALDTIRGFKGKPMVVTSGFRCLPYQEKVDPGVIGAHTLGRAADVIFKNTSDFLKTISAIKQFNDLSAALDSEFLPMRGLGIYIKERFIHMDTMKPDEHHSFENGEERIFRRPAIW